MGADRDGFDRRQSDNRRLSMDRRSGSQPVEFERRTGDDRRNMAGRRAGLERRDLTSFLSGY
jgi:hypothetical protein